MRALTTAICSKFLGSLLDDDVNGRFYEDEAPAGAEFPYVVYMIVSSVHERTFSECLENTSIQFSLFSSSSSSGEVKDMYDHLRILFDECSLEINGDTLIWMREENLAVMIDDILTTEGTGGVRHWAVDYEVLVSKD